MFKFAVPAVAALGLLAFAAHSHSESRAPASESTAMSWHFYTEGDMAKLAYGVPNSDVLAVMLTCEPGQPVATVYGAVQPDTPRLIRASQPVEMDPLSLGAAEETRLPLNDRSLRDLAAKGVLRVKGDAARGALKADAAERRMAAEFLAHCGS